MLYTRGRHSTEKHFSFSAINENVDENEIPWHLRPKTKRKKNENESHLIISVFLSFFIHSITKSALQCGAIPRPVSPFLQVVLVDGIPLSSCTVYRYLYGIFRSTSKSRPNNIRGGKMSIRPYVRPSTKSFFDLNEIWYIGRGR